MIVQFLYTLEAGTNLLGRDLMLKLGIQIVSCQTGITVSMKLLTEDDEKEIDPIVWVRKEIEEELILLP